MFVLIGLLYRHERVALSVRLGWAERAMLSDVYWSVVKLRSLTILFMLFG
jgi:hypothetical protein